MLPSVISREVQDSITNVNPEHPRWKIAVFSGQALLNAL